MPNDPPTNLGSKSKFISHVGSVSELVLGSSIALHAAFGFLIVVLSTLIQIKYQSKDLSPFETHPATMIAFIIVVVIHVGALVVTIGRETDSRSYLPVLRHALLISGALASALLLRILVPLFGLFMFILCLLLSVAISCVWYQKIFGLPSWADLEVFNKLDDWLRQVFKWLHGAVFQVFRKSSTSCNISIEKEIIRMPV
ncbi:hypothetical protein L1049_018994 [Liquidambar formosana]|uniref:Uncharacterized protein n=1 Tax=Liquidambar formosana TaxID=63359 RepID=A0AAP0WPI3_LIQFO